MREEIEPHLVEPLMQQLGIDAGDTVAELARGRLGIGRTPNRSAIRARPLGVTRARVYQMLEECHNVMSIRWPDGRRQLDEFAQWLDENYASAEAANLLVAPRAPLSAEIRLPRRSPARRSVVGALSNFSLHTSSVSPAGQNREWTDCSSTLVGRPTLPVPRLFDATAGPENRCQPFPQPAAAIRSDPAEILPRRT